MSNSLMLLTPLIVFVIIALLRFTGCASFTAAPQPSGPATDPPAGSPPPTVPPTPAPTPTPTPTPGPTPAEIYQDAVKNTAGFAALWPFNETVGTVANVVGPLNPAANGSYLAPGIPAGTGFKVGQDGLLHAKDSTDFAPSFDGSAAYVEVPFNGPLNPDKSVPGFAIELWVKPNPNLGPATQVVLSSHRNDSSTSQQGYEIALIRDPAQPIQQIRGRVYGNGTMLEMLISIPAGDPAEWRYVVMVYEMGVTVPRLISLIVRVAKTPDTYKSGPHGAQYDSVAATASSTLRFGAGHALGQGAENFFAGQIDNVAFYNVALSLADMDKHFNMF